MIVNNRIEFDVFRFAVTQEQYQQIMLIIKVNYPVHPLILDILILTNIKQISAAKN
ncbi:MAG: hypothetical protein RLZZ507_4588 [Cyanobacteriota bacterium]|jgi:hypothetical protein